LDAITVLCATARIGPQTSQGDAPSPALPSTNQGPQSRRGSLSPD
jgi:hypothetical protein